ncbi:MAG: Sensor histidine kinase WalK [Chroococcopsis gigantea SAG 12.99]|jgi:signal transduction histidine kinase|nr:hybrid sensor histidine kinase/response regulator [Chlorogloea purpurea SAG 13.99]MDV2999129.1 Sensor histidine kinase WalK [Chroococcopsis gigantea SAG 12.99]
MDTVKILLIEDNLAQARLLRESLDGSTFKHFTLDHAQYLAEGIGLLAEQRFDVILLDLSLPDSHGLDSLTPLINIAPHLPIVVLTNTNDDHLALESLRRGAQDYLVKRHVNQENLARSICYAIERKQTEEELREAKMSLSNELVRAQEINEMKNTFVSMISHDFRNPLCTISLSTKLLENSRDRLTKEQQISYFQMIRTAIKDMDQLLTEILLIGKADSGRLKRDFQPIDLEYFCKNIWRSFQLQEDENHKFVLKRQGNLHQGLWDENLLKHIFNNLLGNALKYSPAGGTIGFTITEKDDRIIFQVRDEGIGIPISEQSQLFHPFYRATNVENISGTGLGLAIVQRCVDALGGDISVVSEPGKGTTFVVVLPIVHELG